MLGYNSIKPKKIIELDGEPYQVLEVRVVKKQRQKPVNKTKLKHLLTGAVKDHTFQQSDTVEEANIETREVKYLYTNRGEWWFCAPDNPSDRFQLNKEIVEDASKYLKENAVVSGMVFNNEIVGITVPIKMQFEVAEAPPNIRGNTASGGTKPVTLETGTVVSTPMFIEAGDIIEINTESGEYVRRIE